MTKTEFHKMLLRKHPEYKKRYNHKGEASTLGMLWRSAWLAVVILRKRFS